MISQNTINLPINPSEEISDNEDSKSNISTDSDSSQDSTVASIINAEQVEQSVEYELSFSCSECEYKSKSKINLDIHKASHIVEIDNKSSVTYASKIKSPEPKARSSQDFTVISASQPVIGNHHAPDQQLRKRQNSLSPKSGIPSTSRPRYI